MTRLWAWCSTLPPFTDRFPADHADKKADSAQRKNPPHPLFPFFCVLFSFHPRAPKFVLIRAIRGRPTAMICRPSGAYIRIRSLKINAIPFFLFSAFSFLFTRVPQNSCSFVQFVDTDPPHPLFPFFCVLFCPTLPFTSPRSGVHSRARDRAAPLPRRVSPCGRAGRWPRSGFW